MFRPFGPFFVMPACYHPTTALLIDDDQSFTKTLCLNLTGDVPIKSFNHPVDAIHFMKDGNQEKVFSDRCSDKHGNINLKSIRNEIYNDNRFKEIIISITDYDMPLINGFELMQLMQFPKEIEFYSYILLTGKAIPDLDKNLERFNLKDKFIVKNDPDFVKKLTKTIKEKTESMFQWYSYPLIQQLTKNQKELSSALFDFHFGIMFNQLIEENNICELYLYDKQGSYLFLDKFGKLSWLFVRNENGIKNCIDLAKKYKAPENVINALESREVILSLYEDEDFSNKTEINWPLYLLPAKTFATDEKYTKFLNLEPNKNLYYSYTDEYPDHGIETDKVLSFDAYLKKNT